MRDLGDPFLFKAVNENQLSKQINAATALTLAKASSGRHVVLLLSAPGADARTVDAAAATAWKTTLSLDLGSTTDALPVYDGPDGLTVVAEDGAGREIARFAVADPV